MDQKTVCLIAFNWQPDHPQPLLMAANRDEFHQRATKAVHWWENPADVIAGRDLEAGGTWLAASRSGRFAAVTNFRQPDAPLAERSRGDLPLIWMQSKHPIEATVESIHRHRSAYGPFSFLLGQCSGSDAQLWMVGTHEAPFAVAPGLHALSNHRFDSPWPKSRRMVDGLRPHAQAGAVFAPDALFELLHDQQTAPDDQLPDTGVGFDMERL
ncbi:MAG: NRDE family protein, partial [Pseudomonadota bacterium]